MLSKCANPACSNPFLYLREGKLYQLEVEAESSRVNGETGDVQAESPSRWERKPVRRLEFFWLCGRCAASMTLAFKKGSGVIAVPARVQRAAASTLD